MRSMQWIGLAAAVTVIGVAGCASMQPGSHPMSFFVTSSNPGTGANFGGVAGADKFCQSLAQAAGAGNRTWHAYLSTQAPTLASTDFVNARDRIGSGPWYNAKGGLIAKDNAELHGDTLDLARAGNKISKTTALDEKGQPVSAVGDAPPLHHDIMTGSNYDGRTFTDGTDHTCKNWTSSTDGVAQLGHHDRTGSSISCNKAHPSRGCSAELLQGTGSGGLFYCFATN